MRDGRELIVTYEDPFYYPPYTRSFPLRLAADGEGIDPEVVPGTHNYELRDLAANCRVDGANPRTVSVVAGTDPDVVLLDLVMPRGGGSGAALRIKSARLRARVILVSLLGQRELAHATRTAGADGFVCKADIDTHLVDLLMFDRAGSRGGSDAKE